MEPSLVEGKQCIETGPWVKSPEVHGREVRRERRNDGKKENQREELRERKSGLQYMSYRLLSSFGDGIQAYQR